jgi:hypothetical protein
MHVRAQMLAYLRETLRVEVSQRRVRVCESVVKYFCIS